MSVEYSIGVSNRFAQLLSDDEADPFDIIRENEKEKDKDVKKLKGSSKLDVKSSKTVKEQPKTVASKKDIVNDESRKENRGDSRRGGRNQRPGDQVKRENERNVRYNDETSPGTDERRNNNRRKRENFGSTGDSEIKDSSENKDSGERFSGERGRGRGRGGRGGRGGSGFPARGGVSGGGGRGGKREFERRSGSDRSHPGDTKDTRSVKQDDKRGGGGSYNWGSPTDHAEEGETEKDTFSSPKSADWAETSPDPDAVSPAPADDSVEKEEGDESLEEEVQEMSLEEWKQQENARAKAAFNIRRAGEGESKAQWKNTKVLNKIEYIEPLFAPKRIVEEKLKTSGRVLKHLDVDFKFAEAERASGEFRGGRRGRGRGDRGGRGRGRGRGAGRGGRGMGSSGDDDSKLNFDNPEEFPSLE